MVVVNYRLLKTSVGLIRVNNLAAPSITRPPPSPPPMPPLFLETILPLLGEHTTQHTNTVSAKTKHAKLFRMCVGYVLWGYPGANSDQFGQTRVCTRVPAEYSTRRVHIPEYPQSIYHTTPRAYPGIRRVYIPQYPERIQRYPKGMIP